MKKTPQRIPLEQSPLYNLSSKVKLARLIGCKTQFLHNFRNSRRQFNIFKIKKSNGIDKRSVEDPKVFIKHIHAKLQKLFIEIEVPEYIHSGIKGRSHLTNALAHKDAKFCVTLDLESFYQTGQKTFVRYMLVETFHMANDIAYLLSDIATIPLPKQKGSNSYFPTGSPLSQILVFWCYKDTFDYIYRLSNKKHIKFSLYVDDMTFSSNRKIPTAFIKTVENRLLSVGLRLNPKKIKYYTPSEFKIITGCAIKNSEFKAKNAKRYDIVKTLQETEYKSEQTSSILSKIIAQQQIEPGIMNTTKKRLIAIKKNTKK